MASSTEAELIALRSSLNSYKDDTNIDLQRNVYQKYVMSIVRNFHVHNAW